MPSAQKIIHIDMDCFYAAVEIRDNPSLANKPVAVGGSASQRGVIATANYVARKFGIRSAMSSHKALQLCPELILLPGNFQKYRTESLKIRQILSIYTPLIEAISLDEAYLDVSHCNHHQGIATVMAKEIRETIWKETRLTASAGIAPNKFLAKIASDWKKPNGQFTIAPEQVTEFIKKLPIHKIHGVGKVTASKLHFLGIQTCADLQTYDTLALIRHFGKWGAILKDLSFGIDSRRIQTERRRKSLAAEITFAEDLKTHEEIIQGFKKVYSRFTERWEASQTPSSSIKNYSVKIKFFDFEHKSSDRRISNRCPSEEEFLDLLLALWRPSPHPLRLMGMSVGLEDMSHQLTLL